MKKVESTFWGMSLSLTLICLIFTGLMAAVYEITLEPIALAAKQKQENAIKAVQHDFDKMESDTVRLENGNAFPVFITYKSGKWTGTAVESSALGFGGDIRLMVGFDTEGNVIDYSVLSHNETPGLGSKMDPWFKQSLKGRNMNGKKLRVSKDGGDIDAITAATITSRAFLKAVNNAYKAYSSIKENNKSQEP